MSRKDTLSRMLMIRLSQQDLSDLDDLAARVGVISRAALARAAMRRGLREITRDPHLLLSTTETERKRKTER